MGVSSNRFERKDWGGLEGGEVRRCCAGGVGRVVGALWGDLIRGLGTGASNDVE